MSVAPLTTLHVGPVARVLVCCDDINQTIHALHELNHHHGPSLILGGGSNVIIADDMTDLVVIHLTGTSIRIDHNRVRASAGTTWDHLVQACIQAHLAGFETLSGIPGSVGGAIVGNIGAYGTEISSYLHQVHVFDRSSDTTMWMDTHELHYDYRTSILKNSPRFVVLEAEFHLPQSPTPTGDAQELARRGVRHDSHHESLSHVRQDILHTRARKGMIINPNDPDTCSVGSFFTNPIISHHDYEQLCDHYDHTTPIPHWPTAGGVKLAAAWLIEQAGFHRGYPHANAPCRLSTKHALAITNRGSARTQDVLRLGREIRQGVCDTFGITLIPEPVFIGCHL